MNLKKNGTYNAKSENVRSELFQQNEFFDACDLLQVKYEAIRAMEKDRQSLSEASRLFGLSRPTLYESKRQFEQDGLGGLFPKKRGPKVAHKLTLEVLDYARRWREDNLQSKNYQPLSESIKQEFDISIHPRTLQRALANEVKKTTQNNQS